MRKVRNFLGLLRRADDGVAAIEFALWSTLFFMVVSVAMDFGSFYIERGKMNEAITAAAVSSFTNFDNVNFAALPGYVQGMAGEPALAVTTSCNGVANSCTNLGRTCACLKSDGAYVAATCGSTCTGVGLTANSRAGYYMTIRAQQSFKPLIVPNSLLDGEILAQKATVRLQ